MSVDDMSFQEIVKRERYEEIRKAHDRAAEYDSKLDQLFTAGRVDMETVSHQLGRAVKMYVSEVEPVLNPPEGESSKYWEDEPIGSIPLPNGEHSVVRGLSEYVELPDDVTVVLEEEHKKNYHSLPETREVEREVQVPLDVHRGAYRLTGYALADLGLGISTQDPEEGEWDTDYRQKNGHHDPSA